MTTPTTPQRVQFNVKWHSDMDETLLVLNFKVVNDVCAELKCNTPSEVYEQIAACYGKITIPDGKKTKQVDGITNQINFFGIAAEVLYQATVNAYEINGKAVNFSKVQVQSKLHLQLASQVINWFIVEVAELMKIEAPNQNGIVQIV